MGKIIRVNVTHPNYGETEVNVERIIAVIPDKRRVLFEDVYWDLDKENFDILYKTWKCKSAVKQKPNAMADGKPAICDENGLHIIKQEKLTPKFRVGDCMRLKTEAEQGIRDGLPFVVSIKDGIYYCNNEIIPVSKQDDYEYPPFCRANDAPKFKVGDVIRHKVHGDKYRYTVHAVLQDAYVVDNDLVITFNMESEWEIVDTLTEFEQCLKSGTNIYVEQGRHMEDWDAKEDAKELLAIISKEHEAELEQAYKNSDEVQYRRGYRKAIEDSIEFIYEQLQEGTIGCGNIEEFIDNYRKMKDE